MISKNPTCIVNWQTSMALPQRHQYPQARHRQRRCAHHFRIHRRYRLVQGKQSQRTHSGLLQPVVRCRFASENTRRRWYGRHYLSVQCLSQLPGAHTAYRSDPCRGRHTTPHGDGTGLPAFGRLSLTRQSAGSLRLVCHPFPASKRYFGFPGAKTNALLFKRWRAVH